MSWARIDDAMPDSLKVAPLSDAAFRAYVTSICYCARSLSDGFVPSKKAKEFTGRPRVVQELTDACLWEAVTDGFKVHDYLVYNPTREKVLAERAAAAERMKRNRSPERSPEHLPNFELGSPSPSPYLPTTPLDQAKEEGSSSKDGGNRSSPEHLPNKEIHPAYPEMRSLWENRIGALPPAARDEFIELVGTVPKVWFEAAIDDTAKGERPSWSLCSAILRACRDEQRPPSSLRKPYSKADQAKPKSRRYEEFVV